MEERSIVPSADTDLDIIWADKPHPMADIIKDRCLPAVLKMWRDSKVTPRGSGGGFNFDQPLLVYRESKSVKVYARNVSSLDKLSKGGANVRDRSTDTVIVLPIEYKGYFRIMDEDSIPLKTISNVARVMPITFLSGKYIIGFSLPKKKSGKQSDRKDAVYEKVDFKPGIFRVLNLYEDYVHYVGNRGHPKKKILRCLKCLSEDETEVLFPFDVDGEFYVVESKKTLSKHAQAEKTCNTYTIRQLVSMGAFTKPLLLKLVCGEPPNRPCGFTGVIQVFDIVKDRTVVACTLDRQFKLFELPVTPFPLFVKALNDTDLVESDTFKETLDHIITNADRYICEIKVRQNFAVDKSEFKKPEKPTFHFKSLDS